MLRCIPLLGSGKYRVRRSGQDTTHYTQPSFWTISNITRAPHTLIERDTETADDVITLSLESLTVHHNAFDIPTANYEKILGADTTSLACDTFVETARVNDTMSQEEFCRVFNQRFDMGQARIWVYRQKLATLKMAEGESVAGFCHRIDTIAGKAYAGDLEIVELARDSQKLTTLLERIPVRIHNQIPRRAMLNVDKSLRMPSR